MSAVLVDYAAGAIETAVLYSLIGCGFYFASVATRHFCFAATAAFVGAPYSAAFFADIGGLASSTPIALLCAALVGAGYARATSSLGSSGARRGQLLIASIALMIIAENVLVLAFGGASITLFEFGSSASACAGSGTRTVVITLGLIVLAGILLVWKGTVGGKVCQALIESPLNLALRGVSVSTVETFLAAAGFTVLALAGLLWAADGRVKPSMSIEIGVVGAVAFIIGQMFGSGVTGIIAASIGLALTRFALALSLEGDWSMTAVALLLLTALLLRGARLQKQGAPP